MERWKMYLLSALGRGFPKIGRQECRNCTGAIMGIDYSRTLTCLQSQPISQHAQQEAWKLYEGWARKYYAVDTTFKIHAVEHEHEYWLNDNTCLLGKIDLVADTQTGDRFFGDWKTLNPRRKKTWKWGWAMKCQALTYMILSNKGQRYHKASATWGDGGMVWDSRRLNGQQGRRFLVRVAMKSQVPEYDHEWWEYTDAEMSWWEGQIMQIADEIRDRRRKQVIPWQPNFDHCDKYGQEYICPWYAGGCSKMRWGTQTFSQRVSHLEQEKGMSGSTIEGLVILDATRIGDYINCHEKYRKNYEDGGVGWGQESGEALQIGTGLHACLEDYYEQIRESQNAILPL